MDEITFHEIPKDNGEDSIRMEEKKRPVSRLVSGMDPENQPILSVVTKRSYQIHATGACTVSDTQFPLHPALQYTKENDEDILNADLDTYHFKKLTDVVVKGMARAPGSPNQFFSEIHIGNHHFQVLVIGDRSAHLVLNKVSFSDPHPIHEIPLSYQFAYGGWDKIGELKRERFDQNLINATAGSIDWKKGSMYRYPRNPVGKGYLVDLNSEAVDQLMLPNLEDPVRQVDPLHLASGHALHWPSMPLPMAMGWVDPTWFPRAVHFGFGMMFPSRHSGQAEETLRGWAPDDIISPKEIHNSFDLRCTNGASLGLQLSKLQGNESLRLKNIHPDKAEFVFTLPGEYPRMWVDGRNGSLIETIPELDAIILEPDEHRLITIWRGSAPALRIYTEEELENMNYKVSW